MSQIMDADIFNTSAFSDTLPEFLNFFAIGSRDFAANDPRIFGLPFEGF